MQLISVGNGAGDGVIDYMQKGTVFGQPDEAG